MPKFDPDSYLPVESYTEAARAAHGIWRMVLFEFAEHGKTDRDVIIRNFVARADKMVGAVFQLWRLQDYQDCWILFRCLVDRLFHLHYLSEQDQFEIFEAWSFLRQYKAVERVQSDPSFDKRLAGQAFDIAPKDRDRARALSSNPPVWRRPSAENVAKRMNLPFLYRFGYDFASTHVHPMANDGLQDFFTITALQPAPQFPDQRAVLSNTLLVATLIVQAGLNASTLSWLALVYDFLGDCLAFLDTGAEDYKVSSSKLRRAIDQGIELCGPTPPETAHGGSAR